MLGLLRAAGRGDLAEHRCWSAGAADAWRVTRVVTVGRAPTNWQSGLPGLGLREIPLSVAAAGCSARPRSSGLL
jgi:hypothetical protein